MAGHPKKTTLVSKVSQADMQTQNDALSRDLAIAMATLIDLQACVASVMEFRGSVENWGTMKTWHRVIEHLQDGLDKSEAAIFAEWTAEEAIGRIECRRCGTTLTQEAEVVGRCLVCNP